jgi:O-antigen/teichoic acid export membrane protein
MGLTPRRGRSLRRSFSWTLFGNVVNAGSVWLVLVVLAKLGTPEMVGGFAYALAVTAPVILLVNLHLRPILATDASGHHPVASYFALRGVGTGLALLTFLVLAAFAPSGVAPIVLAAGAARAVESLGDIGYGLFQRHERMDLIARSMAMKGILSVATFTGVLSITGNVAYAAVAMAMASGLVLVAYDAPRLRRLARPVQDPPSSVPSTLPAVRRLARTALPLGFVMFLLSVNANVPRYFVEHSLGMRELGIFSAVMHLVAAGTTVFAALGETTLPRLALHLVERRREPFLRLLSTLIALGVALGFGGALLAAVYGREVLSAVYRPEYGQAHGVLFWAVLASTLVYVASALGYAALAMRAFRAQLPLGIATTAVNIGACLLLVPRWGLPGAVAAASLAATAQLLGMGLIVRRAWGQEPPPEAASS